MSDRTYKIWETAVDERVYQRAKAVYLDHDAVQAIQWEDSNGNAFNVTIPFREIFPINPYKIKALPSGGTLYILY